MSFNYFGCCPPGYHQPDLAWLFKTVGEVLDNNQKLINQIQEIMDGYVADGTIENIINDDIFNELKDAIAKNQQDITDILQSYITASSTAYVGMAQLKQDVKEALTGGSTPVVGTNSVNTANLVDGAVTRSKISPDQLGIYINPTNSRVDINSSAMTATFNITTVIGGVVVPAKEQTLALPDTTKYIYINDEGTITFARTSGNVSTFIGVVNGTTINMMYNCPVYLDNVCVSDPVQYVLPAGLNGGEQYLLFDFANNKIVMPPLFYIFYNGTIISLSNQTDIDITDVQSGLLIYDGTGLKVVANGRQGKALVIAYYTAASNLCQCHYPHVVNANNAKLCAVSQDIPIFGDSIVAGHGVTLPFEALISMRAGMRLLNYGIGSSGYIVNASSSGTHLCGNGSPAKGTEQSVQETNNVLATMQRVLPSLNYGKYVAMFAGINDLTAGESVEDIVAAITSCISYVYNQGKIPIVITPLQNTRTGVINLTNAIKNLANTHAIIIDMSSIGLHPSNGYNNKAYFIDGLHPNSKGHEVIANKLAAELKQVCMSDFTSQPY